MLDCLHGIEAGLTWRESDELTDDVLERKPFGHGKDRDAMANLLLAI
jgi:hypothetical protein